MFLSHQVGTAAGKVRRSVDRSPTKNPSPVGSCVTHREPLGTPKIQRCCITWVLPPLTKNWIISIVGLYNIALNRTPNIDCYRGRGGEYPMYQGHSDPP